MTTASKLKQTLAGLKNARATLQEYAEKLVDFTWPDHILNMYSEYAGGHRDLPQQCTSAYPPL